MLYERVFSDSKPTVARKRFTAKAQKFAPGDEFDWRGLGIGKRKARHLFESGHITHPVGDDHDRPEPTLEPFVVNDDNEQRALPDIDQIEDMTELREIAIAEGAPTKRSKAEQREAILLNRSNPNG
jgi:hypothetical protein